MHFAWQAQYQRHMSQAYQEVRALISWEGCISEHQIFRFAKMILRDRCSTSYDLASLFVASAVLHSDGMEKLKDAMVRDRQLWNTCESEASSWWARYNTKRIHCQARTSSVPFVPPGTEHWNNYSYTCRKWRRNQTTSSDAKWEIIRQSENLRVGWFQSNPSSAQAIQYHAISMTGP